MKKNLSLIKKLVVASSMVATSFFVSAKPSIQELTSNKTAEKVAPELPTDQTIPGEINRHTLAIGLGQTFIYGGFGRNGSDAVSYPDLFYSYSASHSFDMVINTHYTRHKAHDNRVNLLGSNLAIKAKIYQLDAFAPYALGGLGFYWPQINGSAVKAVFGITFGAGVDLTLNSHVKVGLLIQYHDPFDVQQDVGSKVEGSYTKMLMTGGYTF